MLQTFFCISRVWEGSTEGKTWGTQPLRVFPEIDPHLQGQVNSMLQVRASVLSLLIRELTVMNNLHP